MGWIDETGWTVAGGGDRLLSKKKGRNSLVKSGYNFMGGEEESFSGSCTQSLPRWWNEAFMEVNM